MIIPSPNSRGHLMPAEVLDALRRGQSVIPMNRRKKPLVKWKRYQTEQTTLEQVQSWRWGFGDRIAGWARITGAMAGVIVLDDDKAGWFDRWGLNPHVRTGSGGFHLLLTHPGWRVKTLNSKSGKRHSATYPGLDIRGDGGYSVICGFNARGGYTWHRDPEPDPLDVLPRDVREFFGLLEPPQPRRKPARPSPRRILTAGAQPSITLLVARAVEEARCSGRNNGGFWLALQLRDHGYSQLEAELAGDEYVPVLWDRNTKGDIEPYELENYRASVTSAYSEPPRAPCARPENARAAQPVRRIIRCDQIALMRPRAVELPTLRRPGPTQ